MPESLELYTVTCLGNSLTVTDNVIGRQVAMPVTLALIAPDLYQSCRELLGFIKAHDMDGQWNLDAYHTISHAQEVLARL